MADKYGTNGIDVINGTEQADLISGGPAGGDPTVEMGDDVLNGLGGNDTIQGLGGNDTLSGGDGNDTIEGGDGIDTLVLSGNSTDYTFSSNHDGTYTVVDHRGNGDGVDIISDIETVQFSNGSLGFHLLIDRNGVSGTNSSDNPLNGTPDFDNIYGFAGDDVINGLGGEDWIAGGEGNDVIDGGSGTDDDANGIWDAVDYMQDTKDGGTQGVVVNLAEGTATDTFADTDTLVDIERVFGTNYDDIMVGSGADEGFDPNGGADQIDGGGGYDELLYQLSTKYGGTSGIVVTFDDGTPNTGDGTVLDSFGMTDTFTNIESIRGTEFADVVTGGAGSQRFRGLGGIDTFDGGSGPGRDEADYRLDVNFGGASGINADLENLDTAGFGLVIDGFGAQDRVKNVEQIRGTGVADIIRGDATDNFFWGGAGNDVLDARAGDDYVEGEFGDDVVTGGAGADELYGGDGTDTVVFSGSRVDYLVRQNPDGSLTVSDLRGGSPDGTDTVTDFELFKFADGERTLSELLEITKPTITSNGGGDTAAVSIAENSASVTTVTASDPGSGATLSYSIVGGADASLFTIDDTTGALSFLTAPDFEVPTDAEADNLYEVKVQVGDGQGGIDTQTISVTVTNIAETHIINGTEFNDNLPGTAEVDIINGLAGNDTLRGLSGDDQLHGGDGNDILIGGQGQDILNGDEQDDTAGYIYEGGGGAVTVNLATGVATDTFGDKDTLVDISNVFGTHHVDTIDGKSPGSGYEGFFGFGGNDNITGGSGDSWVYYDLDASFGGVSGVTVNISDTAQGGQAANTATDGFGDTDTLTNINKVRGTAFADTVFGGNQDFSQFQLGAGSDFVDGGAGTDQIDYRYDNDGGSATHGVFVNLSNTVKTSFLGTTGPNSAIDLFGNVDTLLNIEEAQGSEFADVLIGGAGSNSLSGSGGDDLIDGASGSDTIDGGEDNDTAVFSGLRSNYLFTDNSDGSVTVADQRGGAPDGADVVRNVEFFQFSDGTFSLAQILNQQPSITSNGGGGAAAISIAENGTVVTTVTATDPDAENALSYSIIGGQDMAKFQINAVTGVLSFVAAPNFEAPTDSGTDNVYEVQVQVDDGNGGVDTQTISITVTDVIEGNVISGTAGDDTLRGTAVVDIINGLEGNDTLNGLAGDDELNGGSGNDNLNGGTGNDSMRGGAGNDVYVVDSIGDTIDENVAGSDGTDRVQSSISFSLADTMRVLGTVENLTLTGSTAINGTGNVANNIIVGNNAANALDGGDGDDTLDGRGGNDALDGGVGNDTLLGGGGNDTLDGGAGNDNLQGGAGNDTYVVDSANDIVDEGGTGGTDTVLASITFSLANSLTVLGAIENLTLTGTGNVDGAGNSGNNVLVGNGGDNVLDGGAGTDTMRGGAGNDTYVVDSNNDRVDESVAGSDGIDTIRSSVTFSLVNASRVFGAVENLTLTGSASINATGNALDNVLIGNSGANVLDGGLGADTMQGGSGNDTYVVDNASDTVDEAPSGSNDTDTVRSSITFSLANATRVLGDVENLTLTGAASINATGNGLDNTLIGNSAANVLDGGVGADIMQGGRGNDTYIVDNANDLVNESGSNGIDTILSSVSFDLANPAQVLGIVENLTLTGSADINGTGNTAKNVLIGNSGANVLDGGAGNDTLDGGAGNDTMRGGAGNDTYIVDSANDTIDESVANSTGTDTVQSSISFSLLNSARVLGVFESLSLTGTADINGTGNTANNVLIGNSGANVLDGGAGNDTLTGGLGADTFLFSTALNAATNRDTITDFNIADDTVALDHAIFTTLGAAGTLAAEAFHVGTAAADANDRIIYNPATGTLTYDTNGNAAGGAVQFANIGTGQALTNADFMVV